MEITRANLSIYITLRDFPPNCSFINVAVFNSFMLATALAEFLNELHRACFRDPITVRQSFYEFIDR